MIDWPALEARNALIGAFVEWDHAARSGEGPLGGLTLGVKANLAVRGLAWTGGMGHRRGMIAAADAVAVARLRAAGMAVLGTLNMHEAALGATTDNAFYGRTINPHRAGFTAGGSSGGSAAAVAAGLCDIAVGTDTLGSIRIPAAYCGAYGLKPTSGAVASEGLVTLEPAWDVIGPLAMDLGLIERAWQVLAAEVVPAREPLSRLLVLGNLGGIACEAGVLAGYERALAAIGLAPQTIGLPGAPGAIRVAALVRCVQALKAALGAALDEASTELRGIVSAIAGKPGNEALLAETSARLKDALGTDGVLLTPTTPHAAFAHGARAPSSQADFTALASIAGLPALAVPAGRDAGGLPVSVQLVGPAGSETRLIALARTLEPTLGGAIRPVVS